MKTLNILFFLLFPVVGFTQQYEIGIGFGASINSKPTNNMYFRGDLVAANYATQLTVLRNLKDNSQVCMITSPLIVADRQLFLFDL